ERIQAMGSTSRESGHLPVRTFEGTRQSKCKRVRRSGPRTLQSRRKTNDGTPRRCARLSVRRSLYDFNNNPAVLPRCDRAQNRANRFCGTTLLADHPSEVFLRNPQFEHRGGLALRLLHLHRVRIVYQLLCDELNELLHGITPLKKSKGSFYEPP